MGVCVCVCGLPVSPCGNNRIAISGWAWYRGNSSTTKGGCEGEGRGGGWGVCGRLGRGLAGVLGLGSAVIWRLCTRARVRVVVFLVLLSFFASVRRSVERVFERGPREKVGIVGSRRRGGTTFERDCACDFFGWAVPKPQKRKEDIYVWPLSFRASMEWRFQSASWRRGLV